MTPTSMIGMPDPSRRGTEVLLDTGYLIAMEDADDANHPSAMEHREGLRRMPPFMTTSYVVDEVVTFFNVRGHHGKAVELAEMLLSSPSVTVIHVSEDLLRRGITLLQDRPDKRYSLTDCISFVVMRDREISTAFAFDKHFEQEGFVREPLQP